MVLHSAPHSPIICAIDTVSADRAMHLAESVSPYIGALKLGLEYFVAHGARGVHAFEKLGIPIFLDLKFHDIPNTVAKAIEATAGINTFMMTVHTSGGRAMLQAAIDASMRVAEKTGKCRPYIIGVTTLTSMDQDDLMMTGVRDHVHDHVLRLADLAQSAHLDGVVCSSYEIEMLRQHACGDFLLVVPGVRPPGSDAGDQKRVMTPIEAQRRGADYLVIGRPITQAPDPAAAAQAIYHSIISAHHQP
ncbi:MAG: orotidine-5'-phosphate decarboxylase [Sphaerospermopsis sp. SIO1G2]|nr:orotidine-5'-phosphate decarboxylase [Sphaerospermopsis sp. SIO1G2]